MTANRDSFANADDSSPVVRCRSASRSSIFLLLGSDSAFQMRSVRDRFTCDPKVTCLSGRAKGNLHAQNDECPNHNDPTRCAGTRPE
jgi:hypothetical protein